jgi:hypothetical protein
MGRVKQSKGKKGSLKWIQVLINEYPSILNKQINKFFNRKSDYPIEWLSPKANDNYAEYGDEAFLDLLGIKLTKTKLKEFWPKRGPQWDALGRDSEAGQYYLVEAKANIPELLSDSQAKYPVSLDLIKKSLGATKDYLGCKSHIDWTKGFYQYANRLAHLYYLKILNNLETYLIFVYFIKDKTHIATSKLEWDGAIIVQKQLMGLSKHKLQKNIIEVFIDVENIK